MKRLLFGLLIFPLLSQAGNLDDLKKAYQPTKTDEALSKATAYLLTQQKDTGAFLSNPGNDTAMTALGILALSAVGHQPTDQTKEGEALRRALAFVLKEDRQTPDGYLGAADGSRMYGHGIITLMLTELVGMGADPAQDKLLRERCQKGVDLILRAQKVVKDANSMGGWRYTPTDASSDLSVSVWQVMSLRAARNAGFDVPKEAIDAAVAYIKRSYQSPRDPTGKPTNMISACGYTPGTAPSYAMGAAGLLSLQICGAYDAPEVVGSADWLRKMKLNYADGFFFYGTYYYAQGMFQRGGESAEEAKRAVAEQLLPKQALDGSWTATGGSEVAAGKVYSSSLAILCLAVKYHCLPIYQR